MKRTISALPSWNQEASATGAALELLGFDRSRHLKRLTQWLKLGNFLSF